MISAVKTVLCASAIGLVMAAAPASAGVIITIGGVAAPGGGLTTAVPGATVVTFDNVGDATDITRDLPYLENGVGYGDFGGGGGRITIGTAPGLTATPFGDTTNYLTVPSDTGVLSGGSALGIDLTALSLENTYFGLYWGSIDTYNSITFANIFGGPTFTFTGSDVAAFIPTNPTGDQGAEGSFYVNFFFTGGDSYNTIVLSSSQRAFETDNHAFGQIPEPASLALLGAGLLGLGVLRRRKEA